MRVICYNSHWFVQWQYYVNQKRTVKWSEKDYVDWSRI